MKWDDLKNLIDEFALAPDKELIGVFDENYDISVYENSQSIRYGGWVIVFKVIE